MSYRIKVIEFVDGIEISGCLIECLSELRILNELRRTFINNGYRYKTCARTVLGIRVQAMGFTKTVKNKKYDIVACTYRGQLPTVNLHSLRLMGESMNLDLSHLLKPLETLGV